MSLNPQPEVETLKLGVARQTNNPHTRYMSNTPTTTRQEATMSVIANITPATVVNISYADNRWLGGRVVALVWVGAQVVGKAHIGTEIPADGSPADAEWAGSFDRHVDIDAHDDWCRAGLVPCRPTAQCGFEVSDGNADDPSYAYCGHVAGHAGSHGEFRF